MDWRLAMRSAQLVTRVMAQAAALFQRATASRIAMASVSASVLISVWMSV